MYSDTHLTRNLEALKRRGSVVPALARPDDAVRLEPHDDGVRLTVRLPDGTWHCHPGPTWPTTAVHDLVLIGGGDGSTLAAGLDASPDARVLVLEPDPGLLLLLLSGRDWTPAIEAGRLAFASGPAFLGAAEAARVLRGTPPATVLVADVDRCRMPWAVQAARTLADRLVREAVTNARARARLAAPYLQQSLGNLPDLSGEADAAALTRVFAGVPVVLVAAGPSLDRTLPALRRYQDRALIVASDTTLRPLLAGGVRPHVMVSIDPSELNARHLSGVTGIDDIYLAAEGSLHRLAFPGFAGRTFVLRISNHEPWRSLRAHGVELGLVRAWGSVATAAFDLALRMNAGPIIFTGHDFAYSGNRPYCDNTRFHEEWRAYLAHNPGTIEHYEDQMMNGRPTVEVADITGHPVRTGTQLIAFKEWIADQSAAHPGLTFINATEGGILQAPHIRQMTLTDALATLPVQPDLRDRLRAAHASGRGRLMGARQVLEGLGDPARTALLSAWSAFTEGALSPDAVETIVREVVARWPVAVPA